tara:strand:- start:270 stop:710 length:441 start_codon:yes stop_codon:yes gene_type:complete
LTSPLGGAPKSQAFSFMLLLLDFFSESGILIAMTNEKFIAREKPEISDPWIAYTPENINFVRMATLKSALKLEVAGLKRRGRSVYSIIKEEFGLTGNKRTVLADFTKLIEQKKDENPKNVQKDTQIESAAFVPFSRQDGLLKEKKV